MDHLIQETFDFKIFHLFRYANHIQDTQDNLEIQTHLPHQIQQRVSLVGEQGGEEEEGVSLSPAGGLNTLKQLQSINMCWCNKSKTNSQASKKRMPENQLAPKSWSLVTIQCNGQ